MIPAVPESTWWEKSGTALPAIARNVSTRYLAIGIEALLGLVILPFNVAHLGKSAYGLWMVAASITSYFSVLDLGYSGALVKFVAQYRAKRDARAINEVLSTLFMVFVSAGVLAWLAAVAIGWRLEAIFHLPPEQAAMGRTVLVIISAHVAAGFAFSVFGAVINGFQRYDLNNLVGTCSSVLAAVVNVVALEMGYGLVTLVAATTAVRFLTYFVYRMNAYRVFPALRIRPSLFRRARLREVTGFSVFVLMLDWAAKVNYSVDALVIGGVLGTVAVAVWTVAQRLVEAIQRMTNQLNEVLFPAVVDSDAGDRPDRMRLIFVQGTRLSLATVLPATGALAVLAPALIRAWVGPDFAAAIPVAVLLSLVVAIRVGSATATTVLKGGGRHQFLAWTNVLTAAANLALSLVLVRSLGLIGVAIGTLVPVSLASLFAIFPAACRRVQMGVVQALVEAVWPALWPAVAMVAWLLAARPFVTPWLPSVAVHALVAAVVYVALFLRWGLPPAERRLYLAKAALLLARLRRAEATT